MDDKKFLYSINFNQAQFINLGNRYDIEFDMLDGAIYCFVRQFIASTKCETKQYDGDIYYWISHSSIINNLPMLGIKSRSAVYKRIKKLEDCEVISSYELNKQAARSYYKKGKNWDYLIYRQPSDSDQEGIVSKSEGASDLKTQDNNIQEDNNYNYKQWVNFWNDANDAQCRITDGKREQIRARLRTWSKEELKEAILNRANDSWINGEGITYKTKWNSFWVNDEKVETWLHREPENDTTDQVSAGYLNNPL